jgi:hypothetical protein
MLILPKQGTKAALPSTWSTLASDLGSRDLHLHENLESSMLS